MNPSISNSTTAGTITSSYGAGGIAADNSGTLAHCSSAANVEGTQSAGGIADVNFVNIQTCASTGSVSGYNAAGCTTMNYGNIKNSYSLSPLNGGFGAAGFVCSLNEAGLIEHCFSAGAVSGLDSAWYVGGFMCGTANADRIDGSFWDTQASGCTSSEGALGKTTAQMMITNTFTDAGWDFTSIWNINDGTSYPYLR